MARIPEIIRRNPISQVAAQPAQAGQGFAALANLAKIGEDFVRPKAQEQAKIAGQNAVYRDADGSLKVDARSALGGEMASIHNSAAYAKYLGQKQIDMSESFTEMAQKYEFDPAGFKDAADGYISILQEDENVPAVLKDDLLLGAEQEASRRFNGLYNAETHRNYNEADRNTKTARDMLVDDYVSLYTGGDFEAADAKMKEIESISEFRSNAPYISETPAENEAYLRGARGAAKAARLIRELTDLEGATSISDERRAEIQSVLDDEDISPGVRQKLYTATQGRMKGIDASSLVKGLTDGSYEGRVVGAESGGSNTAKNPNSSAYGPHQFVKGTWMGLIKRYKPEWAKGLSNDQLLALRGDRAKSSEMFQHFRSENQAVLAKAGVPINNATEYLAHFFGAGTAAKVLSHGSDTLVSDIVPAGTIKANPFLKGMTVRGVTNWSARKMTMKASDIAAQQVAIDQIPDQEVRAMASAELGRQFKVQRRIEDAARLAYEERLTAADDTLSTQEIMEDNGLGDAAQSALVSKLQKMRTEQIEVQQTVADMNSGVFFDVGEAKDRNRVDDAFKASTGGEDPLSAPEHMATAAQVNEATGFIPKSMFTALRGAVSSDDPLRLETAMEFANRVLEDSSGALGTYGGRKEVTDALSDYQFFSQFSSGEEAAQRMIAAREDIPKNVTDQAKDAAKDLDISDIVDHFDQAWFSDPSIGKTGVAPIEPGPQTNEMMATYTRLFKDAFVATGDEARSKSRALDEMGRIYGVNQVTGSGRIMKFPPQMFYPAVNGSQDWMQDQLETDLNQSIFGEGHKRPGDRAFSDLTGEGPQWVKASDVSLVSDATTRAQITRGEKPSYVVYYMLDGKVEQAPQRFAFDASPYKAAERADIEQRQASTVRTTARENYYDNATRFGTDVAQQMIREEEGTQFSPR